MAMNVVLDVWGGENSQEHVARFMLSWDLAIAQAEAELMSGYLVNMRAERAWGPEQDFDTRSNEKGRYRAAFGHRPQI